MNTMTQHRVFLQQAAAQHTRLGRITSPGLLSLIPTRLVIAALILMALALAGCGSSSGGSLTTYTSSNIKVSIGYPSGWKVNSDQSSVEFTGSANHEDFIVAKRGTSGLLSPTDIVNQLCNNPGLANQTTSVSSVTIGGQQWMRLECEFPNTSLHQAIEATSYQGNDFVITYESLDTAFASDQTKYYMPMQQSFKFSS